MSDVPLIKPVQGRILVELLGAFKHFKANEERFGTSKIRGIVLAMASDITPAKLKEIGAEDLKIGYIVYFGKYEDSAPYGPDQNQILIKLEEIGGFSDAPV